jgi:UDP-N-acetylmuramyl pentapeptide phosphotransferase/UDP-N-acetylglucosamine-1-phosphate transferase
MKIAFLSGAIGLFIISLLDDFVSLCAAVRFVVQFACAAELGFATVRAKTFTVGNWLDCVLHCLLVVGIVGLLNIYNFMDGIDGIGGSQAVIAGGAWALISAVTGAAAASLIGAYIAAGALGFLTLNWPPAKDAGKYI